MKNWNVYMVYCEDYENVYKINDTESLLAHLKSYLIRYDKEN